MNFVEHDWNGNVCGRCETRREKRRGERFFVYRGGRATVKGHRLFAGIATSARPEDVLCVPVVAQ